jgi:hypothetical protein
MTVLPPHGAHLSRIYNNLPFLPRRALPLGKSIALKHTLSLGNPLRKRLSVLALFSGIFLSILKMELGEQTIPKALKNFPCADLQT